MTVARVAGTPHKFLYKRFPTWKEDKKTYMIPPAFMATSVQKIGSEMSNVPYSYSGDQGESIIFNLLQKLGELMKIGMFVIHGFKLADITKWNKMVGEDSSYSVHRNLPQDREYDFIIFHHKLGVVLLEVKNFKKVEKKYVIKAEDQLDSSLNLVKSVAISDTTKDNFHLVHKRVIALPSTKKEKFHREKFPELRDDTILLFEADCDSIDSFQKWWNKAIDTPNTAMMNPQVQETYELALSYILMIRHLGPVIETDSVSILQHYLVSNKYYGSEADPQILGKKFPFFFKWCMSILYKIDEGHDFGTGDPEKLKEDFLKSHEVNQINASNLKVLIAFLDPLLVKDKRLKKHKYIAGDTPSLIDKAIALLFEETFFLSFENILRFVNTMRLRFQCKEEEAKEMSSDLKMYPFLRLKSYSDLNQLDRHLSKFPFIKGSNPSQLDQYFFEKLTRQVRGKHPLIFTTEQLAVFEGPLKQLIIGPPGSGKSEVMKFKALELEMEMKAFKREKKILYIVANGCPSYNKECLFFHHVKKFFEEAKSTLVEVITIVLEEESPEHMAETVSLLRKKIEGKEYCHVFVDEYWIGSKPAEHKIILDLVNEIPGHVWITSVFDFNTDKISTNDRMKRCTKPLLDTLKQNGGVISHIHQVLRATNSIIKLEREYSALYQKRSYPYGTQKVLGHSLEGLPITWAVEKGLDGMYTKCVDIIDSALKNVISLDPIHRKNLALDPGDVMIVNFAIRVQESLHVKLESYLERKKIPFVSFDQNLKQLVEAERGKVVLLQSCTREISSYLDGVEWPELVDGAQTLRNYDPYISFFRTMVKLVVISDKWSDSEGFLNDRLVKI